MNTTSLVTFVAAVSAVLIAMPAVAQEATPDVPSVSTSTLTRATVQAELMQARKDGFTKRWNGQYNPLALATSERSREAVQAEVTAARQAGELNAMTGEDSGSAYLAAHTPRTAPSLVATGQAMPMR